MSFRIQPTPVARPNRCQLFGPGSRPAIFEKMEVRDRVQLALAMNNIPTYTTVN